MKSATKKIKLSKTREILQGMMIENTGSHFLDSGGAYGRNYDINKGKDFEKMPSATLEFSLGYRDKEEFDIEYTKNLYHFLADKLTYNKTIDNLFQKFIKKNHDSYDDSYFENVENFPAYLKSLGHSVENVDCINSYNGESNLSQVILYTYMRIDNDDVVLLSVHGGCDVRGGYTMPRAFSCDDTLLFEDSPYIVCSENRDHAWGYDGRKFNFEGTYERGEVKGELFNAFVQALPMPKPKKLSDYTVQELGIEEGEKEGHCPLCLKAGIKSVLVAD